MLLELVSHAHFTYFFFVYALFFSPFAFVVAENCRRVLRGTQQHHPARLSSAYPRVDNRFFGGQPRPQVYIC